jgi:hypothetical protein
MADETTNPGNVDQQQDDPEQTGDATGGQKPEGDGQNGGNRTPAADEKSFTQADVDRIVAERLEREKKKAEKAAQTAKEEAEAKALEEQQEFQKLAEKHGKKADKLQGELDESLAKLEEATARVEAVEKALETHLKAQKDGLPESVLELLEKLDTVEQLEYLAKHGESLSAKGGGGGVPPSPRPADGDQTVTTMCWQFLNRTRNQTCCKHVPVPAR